MIDLSQKTERVFPGPSPLGKHIPDFYWEVANEFEFIIPSPHTLRIIDEWEL